MNRQGGDARTNDELELRIRHLEEQARFIYDILEQAANLGDFQTSINKLTEPGDILLESASRMQGVVQFLCTSFYLVDERTSDFVLNMCLPPEYQAEVQEEVSILIDNGIFALALRENRPTMIYSSSKKYRIMLHALSTSSRTRGMFVGLLHKGDRNISGIVLSMLTVILKYCANAIESFELYRLFREKERRYKELADFFPQTVFETDEDGRLLLVSAGVIEQLGRDPLALAGSARLLDLLAPESHEAAKELMKKAMAPQAERRTGCKVRVLHEDGSNQEVCLILGPIRIDGHVSGVKGVLLPPSFCDYPAAS